MNCKDCGQDCQRIGCDIELECSGYVEPSNGTKERMDERLEMMHKLYPNAKPTNADRIRSMTDEELATWISEEYYVPHCPTGDGCPDDLGDHDGCDVCWMKWLKQEAK